MCTIMIKDEIEYPPSGQRYQFDFIEVDLTTVPIHSRHVEDTLMMYTILFGFNT